MEVRRPRAWLRSDRGDLRWRRIRWQPGWKLLRARFANRQGKVEVPHRARLSVRRPQSRAGTCYVGDTDGKFYCFAAATGDPVWARKPAAKSTPARTSIRTRCYSARKTPRSIATRRPPASWFGSTRSAIRFVARPRSSQGARSGRLRREVAHCRPGTRHGDWHGRDRRTHRFDASGDRSERVLRHRGGVVLRDRLEGSENAVDVQVAERNLPFRSSAAATSDALIFGGRDKTVYALAPSDGRELWKYATRGPRRLLAGVGGRSVCSSVHPTAGCAHWTAKRGQRCGNIRRAVILRPRPPWPPAAW